MEVDEDGGGRQGPLCSGECHQRSYFIGIFFVTSVLVHFMFDIGIRKGKTTFSAKMFRRLLFVLLSGRLAFQ